MEVTTSLGGSARHPPRLPKPRPEMAQFQPYRTAQQLKADVRINANEWPEPNRAARYLTPDPVEGSERAFASDLVGEPDHLFDDRATRELRQTSVHRIGRM